MPVEFFRPRSWPGSASSGNPVRPAYDLAPGLLFMRPHTSPRRVVAWFSAVVAAPREQQTCYTPEVFYLRTICSHLRASRIGARSGGCGLSLAHGLNPLKASDAFTYAGFGSRRRPAADVPAQYLRQTGGPSFVEHGDGRFRSSFAVSCFRLGESAISGACGSGHSPNPLSR